MNWFRKVFKWKYINPKEMLDSQVTIEQAEEKKPDISEPVISIVKVIEEAPLNRFTIKTVAQYYIGDGTSEHTYTITDRVKQRSWSFGTFSEYGYVNVPTFKRVSYLTLDEMQLLSDKFTEYFNKKYNRMWELKKERIMRKREELTKLYCE